MSILQLSKNRRPDADHGRNDGELPDRFTESVDARWRPSATFEWLLSLHRMVVTMIQVGSSEVRF